MSIQGGSDLGLFEINEAARLVQEVAHPDANIIFGAVIDDALGDEARVTVIAAGFDSLNPETNSNSNNAAADQAKRTQQAFGGSSTQPARVASSPQRGGSYAQAPSQQWQDDSDVPANAGFDLDLPPVVEQDGGSKGKSSKDSLDVPDFLK